MRNLFGWSSPPKRKDRKYSRLRAAALQDLIQAKEAHQIWVDIEEHGDGYVIPLSLLNIMSQDDGTIKKLGIVKHESATAASGTAAATITAPAGIWEVLQIQASILADATVANRNLDLRVGNNAGMGGVGGTAPDTIWFFGTVVTVSASQYGNYFMTSDGYHITIIDNGVASDFATATNPRHLLLAEGGTVVAITNVGAQAGDAVGIDVLWRKVG